jgi:polyhydroxyalkanoate synthesis regulator phasin
MKRLLYLLVTFIASIGLAQAAATDVATKADVERILNKLDSIEARVSALESRVSKLEGQFEELGKRVDARIDGVDGKLNIGFGIITALMVAIIALPAISNIIQGRRERQEDRDRITRLEEQVNQLRKGQV